MWSTLRDAGRETCPNRPIDTRRRLRKPRPVPGDAAPASPAEVLARVEYNHAASPSPCPCPVAENACVRRLKSLPRIRIGGAAGSSRLPPSPSPSSICTDKMLPPLPPPPAFRAPQSPSPCPGSSSTAGGERTLRKQRSGKDFVREKLARCHPRRRVEDDTWHA